MTDFNVLVGADPLTGELPEPTAAWLQAQQQAYGDGRYLQIGDEVDIQDDVIAGAITDPESETHDALFSGARKWHPLQNIGKAATGPFRILQVGTSIAAALESPSQVLTAALMAEYGQTASSRYRAGMFSGSWETAVNSWYKQPYSGQNFVRLRGSSSSSTLDQYIRGFGDQVVIEWSRESDAHSAEVFVDGVSVGTFGEAGTQRFGNQTVFTVDRGFHTVTVAKPSSGYSYIEVIEIRDSTARGIEPLDYTLGGSSLWSAAVLRNPAGAQVAGIATVAGTGIEALYGRSDIDLILDTFTVNDAGNGSDDASATKYRAWLIQAMTAALGKGTPVILLIEPAGHFAMANDGGSATLHNRYEAVRQHRLDMATLFPHVTVVDWHGATRIADIPTYAATWYPTVTSINEAAGTYAGDFIHPGINLTPSAHQVGTELLFKTLGLVDTLPTARNYDGVRLSPLNGKQAALRVWGWGTDNNGPYKVGALYQDAALTNLQPGLHNDIAASGLSDANGKYVSASNLVWYLDGSAGIKSVVLRLGPNGSGVMLFRCNAHVFGYAPDGTLLAYSGTREFHMSSIPAGSAIYLSLLVSQDAGDYLVITGRVYDAVVSATSFPAIGTAP